MAIDLDSLIAQELGEKQTLEGDISKGIASQAKLAAVEAILADLDEAKKRRTTLVADADARLVAAKATATDVTTALAAIDAMLTKLPGTLTVAKLEALVGADLAAPPNPALKKYDDYVHALADASSAFNTSRSTVEQARLVETKARLDIDRAQAVLQSAVEAAVVPAGQAAAALEEALRAKSWGDFARAYFAQLRAKGLVAVVEAAGVTTAVGDAKVALDDAIDAFADAKDKRLTAEAGAAEKLMLLAKAADQLGTVSAQLLALILDAVVKAKVP